MPETPRPILNFARSGERMALLFFILALLFAWELSVRLGEVPKYLLPAPSDVWVYVVRHWTGLLRHFGATAAEAVSGLLLGIVAGFLLGVLFHWSSIARKTVLPLIVWAESLPKLAMAPLLVLWLGFGITSKVALVVLTTLFPVLVSTIKGLRAVPLEVSELCQIAGFSRARFLLEIEVPFSLPHFFSGVKVAATLSVIGAVVGEFVGSNQGLGFLILSANVEMSTETIFACLGLLGLLGLTLFTAVVRIERKILPWHVRPRREFVSAGN